MGKNYFVVMEKWIAFNASPGKITSRQPFDLFVVLDIEETCAMYVPIEPQEVIEIAAVCVDGTTGNIISEFQSFVKPTFDLSKHCELTSGISQADVIGAGSFAEVVDEMHDWFRYLKVNSGEKSFAFVTMGDRDLMSLMPRQAEVLGIELPDYWMSWVNLKSAFATEYGVEQRDLLEMLAELKIYHVGKQHGGIDAVRNVARIVSRMIWDGKTLQLTYQFGRKYVAAPKGQKPHVKQPIAQIGRA